MKLSPAASQFLVQMVSADTMIFDIERKISVAENKGLIAHRNQDEVVLSEGVKWEDVFG